MAIMLSALAACNCVDVDQEELISADLKKEQLLSLAAENEFHRERERRQQDEALQRARDLMALTRAKEEAVRESQEMARKVLQLKTAVKEEQALFENLRRERHLLQRTAAAKEEEGRKLMDEQERWLRKTAVAAFLKEHGFESVTSSKQLPEKTTFPLHLASEVGDARMVEMLIKEGADPRERDSQGLTAGQVVREAQVRKGEMDDAHEDVLNALAVQSRARLAGA